MNPDQSPLLACQGVTLTVADRVFCRELDLQLDSGQIWGLLGANGTGKTTLLHSLAGLRPLQHGRVLLNGVDMIGLSRQHVARHLGLLLQDSSDPFPATVMQTVLLGRHPHLSRWQWESDEDHAIARQALHQVGLSALIDRRTDSLSGGERRRLALATLLTQQVPIMLLDEPTNHLDLHHQIELLEIITRQTRRSQGLVCMSLHDINLAARFCTHLCLLLGDGEVVQGECQALLREDLLSRLYAHPIKRISAGADVAFIAQ